MRQLAALLLALPAAAQAPGWEGPGEDAQRRELGRLAYPGCG